jgi:hypothetical protein
MEIKSTPNELSQYRIPDDDLDALNAPITDVSLLTPDRIEQYVAQKARPKSLNLTCGRSECDKELHTFRPLRIDLTATGLAPCTKCGYELTRNDTSTIRNSRDVETLFATLQTEWIRHFFFHLAITDRIEHYAAKHGRDGLARIAGEQLQSGRMIGYSPRWDSQQTAMLRGTIIHWARHAVACCCRRCMAYWHGIPMSSMLTEADVEYFQELIMRYVDIRLPDLAARPQKKDAHGRKRHLRKAG